MNGFYTASAVASPLATFPSSPLEALHAATLAIYGATTLQGVLQASVDGALSVAGASSGTIYLARNGSPSDASASTEEPIAPPSKMPRGNERVITLFWHGREAGTLRLQAGASGFAPGCERALELLGDAIASALDNTRRFEMLSHAKREWELIFDSMVDGVYIAGRGGTVLRANRAFADAMGLRINEILGRRREALHARLPHYAELRAWTRDDNAPPELELYTCEYRFGAPERSFVETRFALLSDNVSERETERLSIVRDVTEARHLQEQLLQSEKLAALGELVSGVAHELNNPLTTVVGYGQLLESDADLPPRARRQVGMIHQEAQRATHIVQNLLAFARRSVPQKTRVSINDVLGSLVRMRAYQLAGDNIRVTTRFAPDLPPVLADPMQLQQVFLNIVNNAAHAVTSRHAQRGGEVRIATEAVPDGAGVRISIQDNGIGMTPELLRRVFDPFFTTKGVGQGTGLGMSISLGIVSSHNGRIYAHSRPDHGTTFFIDLPAALRDTSVAAASSPEPDANIELPQDKPSETESPKPENAPTDNAPTVVEVGSSSPAPQSHVLVVDDEEPVVTLISEIVMLDGHRVTPAFNGAEALALLETEDFDLIISDVRMPAIGGPTFFETLQTSRPDLLPRVIFVTGDTVSRSTQEFLSRAKRPVLSKPFDPERLRALVAEILGQN